MRGRPALTKVGIGLTAATGLTVMPTSPVAAEDYGNWDHFECDDREPEVCFFYNDRTSGFEGSQAEHMASKTNDSSFQGQRYQPSLIYLEDNIETVFNGHSTKYAQAFRDRDYENHAAEGCSTTTEIAPGGARHYTRTSPCGISSFKFLD